MKLLDSHTKKLLEFTGMIKIKHLGLKMLVTRLRMTYSPQPAAITKNTAELNELIGKFPAALKPDYDWIISL